MLPVIKNVHLLKIYNFLYDFRPYGAIAILYFAEVTGSYTAGFSIFSIAALSNALFEVPTGIVSDYLGRKKTVVLCSITSTLAMILYAFAPGFWLLALGAIVNGIARAFFSGNNDALLYDSLLQAKKEDSFNDILGTVQSYFEVGLGISALLGGLLAVYSFQLVFIVSIIPQLFALFVAFRFIEPRIHNKEISGNIYRHLQEAFILFKENIFLQRLSLTSILEKGIGQTLYDFKPAFVAGLWPTWALGISRTLDNVFGFIGFRLTGPIVKRYKTIQVLLYSKATAVITGIVFSVFPNIVSPIIMSSHGVNYGIEDTARKSLLHKEYSTTARATMGSLDTFAGSILFGVVSIMTGIVTDQLGTPYTVAILFASMSFIWILYFSIQE